MKRSRTSLFLLGFVTFANLESASADTSKAAPAPTATQTPPQSETRAEVLFRSGEKKFDAESYAEACADFAESLRLGPKLGTLLNLALCHETVGKTATAWGEFHHAAAWAAQNGQKDRRAFAAQHALALETKLPRVLLDLPADGALGSVDIDGEPMPDSDWHVPVFLDPGEHVVTARAPGKKRSSVTFRVAASTLTEQIVKVPPLEDDEIIEKTVKPHLTAQAPEARDPKRLAGIVGLGLGAAGVAVGMTFGVLAIQKRDAIGSQCSGAVCTPGGAELYRDAQSRALVATVSSVVGVTAGAVGAWLFFTARQRPRAPAVRVDHVGVTAAGSMTELRLGGSF